jgi:hypothetical protein
MKVAVMQPYFFPYIGYFQLLNAVDEFIIHDNVQYTKKGWINRNRILVNGRVAYITLPVRKDSFRLEIKERFLANSWSCDRKTMLARIANAYRKSPNYEHVYPLIEKCILFDTNSLSSFIINSLSLINEYLKIRTPILISSVIPIDHELKAGKKVIALCKARHATEYINPIGGIELYKKDEFWREGIDLFFLKSHDITYGQYDQDFVPWLSIIDILMFNPIEKISEMLNRYALVN